MRRLLCLYSLPLAPLLLDDHQQPDTKRNAICILYPNNNRTAGLISFSQDSISSPVKIACSLKGLNPNCKHAISIYEYGDPTAIDGNLFKLNHQGARAQVGDGRDTGNIGKLQADPFGAAYFCHATQQISLFGDDSILGRTVGIQAAEDEIGAKKEQIRGMIASGLIGLSK